MSITVKPYKTAAIVRVGKTLDYSNAQVFKEACLARLDRGARHFILDFSETGILDSTGLGAIFSLYRETSLRDGRVVFASTTSPVQMVIKISKISRVFESFTSVEEACAAVGYSEPSLHLALNRSMPSS
jgi:anti-sigma B factor antagonist